MNSTILRRISVNTTILLVTTIFCAMIAEGAVRIFHKEVPKELTNIRLKTSPYYQYDADLGWRPRANVSGQFRLAGSFETTFKTNSRGLRSREFEYIRTPGKRRIVVLGDSFTWGFGVNDDETYAAYLEKMLPDTEVINLGVTAYGLPQEIKYYELEGRKYNPDILIVGFCMNDIYRPAEKGHPAQSAFQHDNQKSGNQPVKNLTPGVFAWIKRGLAKNSATYRFVIERVNTNKNIVKLLVQLGLKDRLLGFEGLDVNLSPALRQYPKRLQQSWEMTKADILRLKRMTDETGVRLAIAIIPALPSVSRPAFEHSIAYTRYEAKDFDLEKPYRQLNSFLRQHDIEAIDVLDRFRSIETKEAGLTLYLKRDMHFNARGQKVFARGIADQINRHP